MAVKPVPDENQPMAPHLVVKGASRAIEFYVKAFDAKELYRLAEPSGKVGHAELTINGGRFMLADEYPDFGALSPATLGGSAVTIHLYVPDVDKWVARAVEAGASVLRPLRDEFYGDRVAMLACPFGHKWHLATHKEDVSIEEMQRRMAQAFA
jgi:PhnB protein